VDGGNAQRAGVQAVAVQSGLDRRKLAATPTGLGDADRGKHGQRPVLQPPQSSARPAVTPATSRAIGPMV
jgi:hypothetical protein